ncbi:hypothetical protein D9M68_589610 [compost metagenome]
MQHSQSFSAGELIKTFRHGKVFVYFLVILGFVCLGMAGFVMYLSTIAPKMNPALFYGTFGLLLCFGLGAFWAATWQKKLRRASYDVYEKGIAQIIGNQTAYTPYTEIEDLYLFSSGQTILSGMATNLAYRRNASEPFRWISEHLWGFMDFQQLVRERYLNERQPAILETLASGGAVTFNYISTGQVWRKRVSGKFLNISTLPIVLTRDALEVQGHKIPLSSLRSVDLNTWTEKVVIKDASGNIVLSTIGLGILSLDLFLNTLSLIREADFDRAAATPA